MPSEDQGIIECTSKGYEEYAQFVLGNDFECFKIQHSTTTRNNKKSYTDIISTHEPNSYAIHTSISNHFGCNIDEADLKSDYLNRGDDTIGHFIICLTYMQKM